MDKDLILIIGGVLVTAIVIHGIWLTRRAKRDRLSVHLAADVPEMDYEEGDILGPARVVPSLVEQAPLGLWNATEPAAEEVGEWESPLLAPAAPRDVYAVAEASVGERLEEVVPATIAEPVAQVADVLARPIVPADAPPVGQMAGAPIIPSTSGEPALAAAVASRATPASIRARAQGNSAGNGGIPVPPVPAGAADVLALDAAGVVSEDVVREPAIMGGAVPIPPVVGAVAEVDALPAEAPAVVAAGGRDAVRRTKERPVGRPAGRNVERASASQRDRSARERNHAWGSGGPESAADQGTEEVFVINVLARNGGSFNGADLFEVFMRSTLKFRDMNIFHRLDPVSGAVRFSVANAVEPGIFDLSDMASLETPGVSLFFRLPGPEQPGVVLDDMLRVARDIGKSLGGDLKDENMSVLTGQTLSHFKQRMVEFSRKRMSMRAANG